MAKCKCKLCHYEDDAGSFKASMHVWYDLACPQCSGLSIDTSEVAKESVEQGKEYKYGKDNMLVGN